MPKPPCQSDFVYERRPEVAPADPSLPQAIVRSNEANAVATKWVLRITVFLLFIGLLLCLIGPHLPSGE